MSQNQRKHAINRRLENIKYIESKLKETGLNAITIVNLLYNLSHEKMALNELTA